MADLEWLHQWFELHSQELKELGIDHKCVVERTYTDNPATTFDLESEGLIGSISLWENGLCDFVALDLKYSPEKPLFAHSEILSENDLDQFLSNLAFLKK
jgi:hypothetical protein